MAILLLLIVVIPTLICLNIALWFFGVRPYIHQHGHACITAANWGYSIWADPTTAWEIGKEDGRLPLCVKSLLGLQVLEVLIFVLVVIGSGMQWR